MAQYASRKGYRHLLVGPLTLEELDRATCQIKGCHWSLSLPWGIEHVMGLAPGER